jgi:predicted nucleotidyltransferase
MDMPKTLKNIIRGLLRTDHYLKNMTEKSSIIAIYLFGSFAKGIARRQSDVDLAFVFREYFYREDPFRALQEAELFCLEISRHLQKPVDVIILNSASLIFTFHALRQGVCLYESNTVDISNATLSIKLEVSCQIPPGHFNLLNAHR